MSGKDPFQILADEITLIRGDVERLQRTSLDKDEAKELHKVVATGVADMRKISPELQQILDARLREAMADVKNKTRYAAHEAAERAVIESHAESIKAAHKLTVAAGEARREAWRYFGGFWVWIVSVGALGAVLGSLATVAVQGRGDAEAFGLLPRLYCERAGGENLTTKDGRSGCMVWHGR